MTTYRERLTAPLTWWLAALGFAFIWGWVFLVATTWSIAIVVFVVLAVAGCALVWRYGSLLISVGRRRAARRSALSSSRRTSATSPPSTGPGTGRSSARVPMPAPTW